MARRGSGQQEAFDDFEGGRSSVREDDIVLAQSGVVRVGKRDYAVGLYWHPVENPGKAAAEARAHAKKPDVNGDFFCLRGQKQSPQYAIGSRESDHKRGMPSLAAHFAQSVSEEKQTIAAFAFDSGWYVIAVRDGAVMPDTDKYFAVEEDARTAFEESLGSDASEWDVVIAPLEWEVKGASQADILSVLKGRPGSKLQAVKGISIGLRLPIAGLAVAAAAGGVYWYQSDQEAAQERVEAIYQQTQQAISGQEKEKEAPPPPPWENRPVGVSFLATCISDMKKFPQDVPGWKVAQIACENRMVAVELRRDGGSINWIQHILKPGFQPAIEPLGTDAGTSTVAASWPMSETETHPAEIRTYAVSDVKKYLQSHFDEYRTGGYLADFSISDGESNQFFRGLKFSFAASYDPLAISSVLSRIPAMVISRVSLDIAKQQWKVEGQVYEKLPVPVAPANSAQ